MKTKTKTHTFLAITTMVVGKKNYIHSFATGMDNKLMPRFTTDPQQAFECNCEAAANALVTRISPGFQRQFTVEPVTVPATPDHSDFAMRVYLEECPHRSPAIQPNQTNFIPHF